MPKRSAGLLVYRRRHSHIETFLVHPGGPFWARKNLGAWSIPKGEYEAGEPPLEAAKREFLEETGFAVSGDFIELGSVTLASGKVVSAWAVEGDCEPRDLISNTCQVEWPPHSGRQMEIPEVDRGEWFFIGAAREHIQKVQEPFLDRLSLALSVAE